jgi:isopenicillin N synthase-like dioxygenase
LSTLPIVDLQHENAVGEIRRACLDHGFFYVAGHGIPADLLGRLEDVSRRFFALPKVDKTAMAMALGGRAWRGYFPLGGELTSGEADAKEGIYFGEELGPEDPRVLAGTPLHGANLWPEKLPQMRAVVLEYLEQLSALSHRLLSLIARGLSLPQTWFCEHLTADPIVLFRIFHYPPAPRRWGVGEHTDYGLLTLVLQDGVAGLEVKTRSGWIPAPPIDGTFVCNIGDMLDRMTRGRYRSTAHRVRNISPQSRLSYAFFFDPAWNAALLPIPGMETLSDDREERWDRSSVHELDGTYGEYLIQKVSRVFPELAEAIVRPG